MSFQPNLKQREKYNHETYNENSQLIKKCYKIVTTVCFSFSQDVNIFRINLCFYHNKKKFFGMGIRRNLKGEFLHLQIHKNTKHKMMPIHFTSSNILTMPCWSLINLYLTIKPLFCRMIKC